MSVLQNQFTIIINESKVWNLYNVFSHLFEIYRICQDIPLSVKRVKTFKVNQNLTVLFYSRDMIDWDDNISEPPPTQSISVEDLKKIESGEKNLTDFIPKVVSFYR